MEGFGGAVCLLSIMAILLMFCRLVNALWISPSRVHQKLRNNGFVGPAPVFPFGNGREMMKKKNDDDSLNYYGLIHHDIHSTAFPHFARWQKLYGKVFIYWIGTEPFLYIADPEFLKEMAGKVATKNWGKPDVFKKDRNPMFGNGLLMTEGEEWVHRRHLITPAFAPSNLKEMTTLMVDSTMKVIAKWCTLIRQSGGNNEAEIDVEKEFVGLAGEIIARSSFGTSPQDSKQVLQKLKDLQFSLFKSNRLVGVPYSNLINPRKTLEVRKLGKEIDSLLISIISDRKGGSNDPQLRDLLGVMIEDGWRGKKLTNRELVDECKTFFFGGHETTALALTWTLLLLALHPEWQGELREEIKQVFGEKKNQQHHIDANLLPDLKKMGWVMNEVLRLYCPAPNTQRQVRNDIVVHGMAIPRGTNVWIDVVSLSHDRTLWGDGVHEFRPERFRDDAHGGCNHKMGYIPFGFGGRMCIGRNLTMTEYKVVLSLMLARFSFEVSPKYRHSPVNMLSLRPNHGLPLIVRPLIV